MMELETALRWDFADVLIYKMKLTHYHFLDVSTESHGSDFSRLRQKHGFPRHIIISSKDIAHFAKISKVILQLLRDPLT